MYQADYSFQVNERIHVEDLSVRAKAVIRWLKGTSHPELLVEVVPGIVPDLVPGPDARRLTKADCNLAYNGGKMTTKEIWNWLYSHGIVMI